MILGVGVLVDHPRKPINLTWQNSTSRGIGQKYQIDPNWPKLSQRINPWEPDYFGGGGTTEPLIIDFWTKKSESTPFSPINDFGGGGTSRPPHEINSLTWQNYSIQLELCEIISPVQLRHYFGVPSVNYLKSSQGVSTSVGGFFFASSGGYGSTNYFAMILVSWCQH